MSSSTQKEDDAEMAILSETVIPATLKIPDMPDGNGNGNGRDPFSPTSPTSPTLLVSPSSPPAEIYGRLAGDENGNGNGNGNGVGHVSVEEAVQNVSLG